MFCMVYPLIVLEAPVAESMITKGGDKWESHRFSHPNFAYQQLCKTTIGISGCWALSFV
jgi:hypothetical protein